MSDLIAIAFFGILLFFFTKDAMTSLFGAFSIYLWFGAFEIKDYPVINKILVISLVTYNIIFIAGLISFYLKDPIYINTTFSFSFWIILGLGFLLFGRKYIVVWRFLSPAYLTLFLYVIAWLAVVFVNQYTPLHFKEFKLLDFDYSQYNLVDFILNIYFVLMIVNWLVYFVSGPILDKMLGIKRVKDEKMLSIVDKVKKDVGIKGKVKVGFGKYPILNAMAYGSVFDNRIAIIAEDMNQIPEDELKGIVAHELAHTKGKHTLILTFIASGDLVVRLLLGLPATYYDYTFGNPQIPMISFILLNFVIYMFLYVFVRILEGRADLKAKNVGYAKELAKALYNLESFYAYGREIGLNTMLLCDEKITKDNQLIDYIDTAQYLYRSLIRPSRGSLLSNFLNSHPPTYYRIAAILGDDLKPNKEALLPFICLKRSKQKKYAKKFEKARNAFKVIANEKFKEFFDIKDISQLLEDLRRKELYKLDIGKEFLFKNKITNEYILGKLEDVRFLDDACAFDQYIVTDLKSNQKYFLDSTLHTKVQIDFNERYFLKKDTPLILTDIELDEAKISGNYVFLEKNKNKIVLPLNKTKLTNSVKIFDSFKGKDIFLKIKGNLKVYECLNVISAENFNDYEFELQNVRESVNNDKITLKIRDLIIILRDIHFFISRSAQFRESELELLRWLQDKQLRTMVHLKKPVNNLEIGYIQKINFNLQSSTTRATNNDSPDNDSIVLKNIFGKEVSISYRTLELISFEYPTAIFQQKSETSFFSVLGYKLSKKFNPQKIII